MAKNDYRVYATAYKNIVKNQVPVTGCKYDTEVSETIENIDDFRQCYKKGDTIREQLPRYWFISKEGFLISVRNKKEPKWIRPNLDTDRPQFKISKSNKPITTYTLVSIVWGSDRTANAQKVMDERGLQCIGRLEKERGQHIAKVQGHHIEKYCKEKTLESYIANNDPTNIQLVTVREHDILNKMQEGNTDSIIFYQPDFANVPNNEIQVYDIEKPRILDIKNIKIIKVVGFSILPLEKDSIITDKYIFVLEDGRKFLEEHQNILVHIAEEYPPKFRDIRLNQIPYTVNGHEYTIFYQNK